MKVKDIIKTIELFAPLQLQEHYDNSGLIIGDSDQSISGILLCLDVTEEVLQEALANKCNFIISHHPLIFTGLKKITGKDATQKIIITAIKNQLAIYAAHTNLDNITGGVNSKICEKLGLINQTILQPKSGLLKKLITYCPLEHSENLSQALFKAGAGQIGNYSDCSFSSEGMGTYRGSEKTNPFIGEPGKLQKTSEQKIETIFPSWLEKEILNQLFENHPYEEVAFDVISLDNQYKKAGSGMVGELPEEVSELEFLNTLKIKFNARGIRYSKLLNKKVKKVAVCGGSGSFLLKDAIRSGADLFITSDFKYHQFFEAEEKIVIADIGHYESEQYTLEIIYAIIMKKIPTFVVRFSEINTNPINYL
jgi:dinuclear metal center YbgI/SA1388 family protein